jgi:cytochrome c peroxidase
VRCCRIYGVCAKWDSLQTGQNVTCEESRTQGKRLRNPAHSKHRNVKSLLRTGPYFHDGSQATLWDVVDHYNKGDGIKDSWLDEDILPLALHENQIDDLVAFLASLTSDEYKEPAAKELERQRALSRAARLQRDTVRAFGPKPVQPTPPKP